MDAIVRDWCKTDGCILVWNCVHIVIVVILLLRRRWRSLAWVRGLSPKISLSPVPYRETYWSRIRRWTVRNCQILIASVVKICNQCLQTASHLKPTEGLPSPDPLGYNPKWNFCATTDDVVTCEIKLFGNNVKIMSAAERALKLFQNYSSDIATSSKSAMADQGWRCLLYTSDAADE